MKKVLFFFFTMFLFASEVIAERIPINQLVPYSTENDDTESFFKLPDEKRKRIDTFLKHHGIPRIAFKDFIVDINVDRSHIVNGVLHAVVKDNKIKDVYFTIKRKKNFKFESTYYFTIFHEIAHWHKIQAVPNVKEYMEELKSNERELLKEEVIADRVAIRLLNYFEVVPHYETSKLHQLYSSNLSPIEIITINSKVDLLEALVWAHHRNSWKQNRFVGDLF